MSPDTAAMQEEAPADVTELPTEREAGMKRRRQESRENRKLLLYCVIVFQAAIDLEFLNATPGLIQIVQLVAMYGSFFFGLIVLLKLALLRWNYIKLANELEPPPPEPDEEAAAA